MSKFKIGDRVRLLGKEYVVSAMGEEWIGVEWGPDHLHLEDFFSFISSEVPIQTETRRVLKPGVYGIVSVKEVYPFHDGKFTLAIQPCAPNAEELESAAMVLSQLAEFLREQDA